MKKKLFSLMLALVLLMSSCSQSTASNIYTVTVGDLTGVYQKPAGCNDPCPSLLAKFTTTNESLTKLNPSWYVNWGDGTPEEQLMEGSHTYPPGPPKEYTVTFRGDVVDGPATWSTQLQVKLTIPFEVPTSVTEAPEVQDAETVPLEDQ